jgi:hypothetical protein
MTPKEKAEELYNKMYLADDIKQSVLIVVDEILKLEQARLIVGSHNYYDYYQEVKQEIEKL